MEPNPYQSPAEIQDEGEKTPESESPQPVAVQGINDVWYATPFKVRSPLKLRVFDDGGFLCSTATGLTFCGSNGNIQMPVIRSVTLTHQTPPWMLHLVLLVVAFFGCGNGWLFAIGVVLFVATMAFVITRTMPWIKVEFTDDSGALQTAYYADGSQAGWGGVLGGTRRLQQWIVDVSKEAKNSDQIGPG